jgi:hypothetical protein
MALNKFEEGIKDKLENRRIKPSDKAWSKLSEKLDEQEDKSNNKIIWWLGIAAGLAGVLLVTNLFLKNGDSETVLPTLVESPVESSIEIEVTPSEEIEGHKVEDLLKNEVMTVAKSAVSNQPKKKSQNILKKSRNLISNRNAFAEKSLQNPQLENDVPQDSELIMNEQNINEALAENNEEPNKQNIVTYSEIELLLKQAQKDLTINKIEMDTISKVSASSLLQDVETDLDESFRDKIFTTIVSGYNVIVTAVAERNN